MTLIKFERNGPLPTTPAKIPETCFTPTVEEELAKLEQDLGGRQALVGILALAPLTRDLQYILGLLGDPQRQRLSLADLCAAANVLPGDLLKHLTQAALARGRVLAAFTIGAGIPAVTADLMRRAAPFEDVCNGGCRGTGSITPDPTPEQPNPAPEPCETCRGTGKLLYKPDLERQKLAVDLAQLLPKGGGVNIAVQQNNQVGGSTLGQGLLERFQAVTDKILYGEEVPGGYGHSAEGEGAESPTEGEVVEETPPQGEEGV